MDKPFLPFSITVSWPTGKLSLYNMSADCNSSDAISESSMALGSSTRVLSSSVIRLVTSSEVLKSG